MLDWLWPIPCVGCGETGAPWCADCAPGSVVRPPVPGGWLEAAFAVDRYDRPVGQALKHAKVSGDRTATVRLAALFAARMAPALAGSGIHAVVPAPSTWRSRAHRGFATAPLLAAGLAGALRVPVRDVLRTGAGTRMATLGASGRRAALAGRITSRELVPGRVLLVDDVITSGATAEACAVELLGGASDAVLLATLCAVPPRPTRRCRAVAA